MHGIIGSNDMCPVLQTHKANNIVNRLLEEDALSKVGLVVVDEIHMMGESERGYVLELLVTKLLYKTKRTDTLCQVTSSLCSSACTTTYEAAP